MDYKSLLFSFSGRIGRQTYWLSSLGLVLFLVVLSTLAGSLDESAGGIVSLIGMVTIGYMGFALAAKRWHDRDKSGWWSLIAFIPIVGSLWMLVELGFLAGTRGPNRFGPDPIRPVPVLHEGQTYYRQSNGSFTDAVGSPVTNLALIGALGAAYVAATAATGDAWSSSALDRGDNAPTDTGSDSNSGSWWSSSSSDSGSSDSWGGGDSGGWDSGGGGGGGD